MRKILLLITACFAAFHATSDEIKGTVNARMLNMRLQPSLKSAVAGRIKQGQEIVITGKKGSWLEILAPEEVKVYISEAYVSNGKTIAELTMRSSMSSKAQDYGKLPKGTAVKVTDERAYGWVRIQPPAGLKVYVASTYVTCNSEDKIPNLNAPAKAAEAAPAKETGKNAAGTAEKTTSETTVKQEKAPAAAPAKTEEPAKEQAAAPAKTEEPAKEQAAAPAKPQDRRIAALAEFQIDVNKEKNETITVEGVLLKVASSVNLATDYFIAGDNSRNLGFVCAEEDGMLTPFVKQRVKVSGRKLQPKGWSAPIIWLEEIDRTK